MTTRQYALTLRRRERQELTLDELAIHADVHSGLVERFVEFGLIVRLRETIRTCYSIL